MSRELFHPWAWSSYFHTAASEAKSQNAILVNIGLTNCAGHRDITSGIEFHCYDSNWANDDETNTISSIFFRGYFPGCAFSGKVNSHYIACVRGRWKQRVSMKRIDAACRLAMRCSQEFCGLTPRCVPKTICTAFSPGPLLGAARTGGLSFAPRDRRRRELLRKLSHTKPFCQIVYLLNSGCEHKNLLANAVCAKFGVAFQKAALAYLHF